MLVCIGVRTFTHIAVASTCIYRISVASTCMEASRIIYVTENCLSNIFARIPILELSLILSYRVVAWYLELYDVGNK